MSVPISVHQKKKKLSRLRQLCLKAPCLKSGVLTVPFHFSPLSVLIFSLPLYNLTSIFSSLWAHSSISRILSPQLSPVRLSHTTQIKIPLFQYWHCVLDWNQSPDLCVVVRYGHKKPALSQAGLSLVFSFWKGIPQSCLNWNKGE